MFTLYNEHPGCDTSHDPDGSHYEYIAIVLFVVSKYFLFRTMVQFFAALLFCGILCFSCLTCRFSWSIGFCPHLHFCCFGHAEF